MYAVTGLSISEWPFVLLHCPGNLCVANSSSGAGKENARIHLKVENQESYCLGLTHELPTKSFLPGTERRARCSFIIPTMQHFLRSLVSSGKPHGNFCCPSPVLCHVGEHDSIASHKPICCAGNFNAVKGLNHQTMLSGSGGQHHATQLG